MKQSKDNLEQQKPLGAIFVNALALSRVASVQSDQSFVTNLTFEPHGNATIHLKDGQFDIDLHDCAASTIDASDGVSAILMLSPAAKED
ncbi:hypothetical protein [Paraburkholderia bannensis]|uniref:hypothetical protein n=1 Tax=Paraburkholderia bannensis TaxID=765414 RepID=UPI002AB0AE3B|nr:hypothetical protein [Paraburkholderia bannensis]